MVAFRAAFVCCRFVFCAVVVLICHAGPSHAGEKGPVIGRWEIDSRTGSASTDGPFTIDIVTCGNELCGIQVNAGKCGGVVLKPYVAPKVAPSQPGDAAGSWRPEGFGAGKSDVSSPQRPNPLGYLYSRSDLQEEFLVRKPQVGSDDVLGLVGEPKGSAEDGYFGLIQRRSYPLHERFKRVGAAECGPPATS